MRILKSSLVLAAASLCAAAMAAGQSTNAADLGVGRLLVSSRGLGDPNFVQSVVLLIQYDQQGAVGLMINRRTQAPISRILKDVDTAKHGAELAFVGGPVELDSVLALLRSEKKPDEGASVVGQVYLLSAKTALEKALAASSGPGDVRVYLGYCGWGPGQLDNEMSLGGWWVFAGDAKLVFDPHPETVWSRLIAQTEQQIIEARPPGAGLWAMWLPVLADIRSIFATYSPARLQRE